MDQFSIDIKSYEDNGHFHLVVEGKLYGMDAIKLKNLTQRRLSQSLSAITIDLSKLDDIDLTGINMLAMLHKKLEENRTPFSIILASPCPFIEKIKETKLHRFLPLTYQSTSTGHV